MSKFVDTLQRCYKTVAQPMGFHKDVPSSDDPPLLIIADITKATAKATKDVIANGIDAVVINSAVYDSASFAKLNKNGGGVPLGLLWDDTGTITISDFTANGGDFIIFGLKTPVDIMHQEGLGKFLRIDSSLTPTMVKTINELPLTIDGVLLDNQNSTLTVELLLTCKLFSDLLSKPLIITTNSKLSQSELENLYKAGVNVILTAPGISAGDLTDMKETIAKLPRNIKKRESTRVILPGLFGGSSTSPKEEPEEEEEDI